VLKDGMFVKTSQHDKSTYGSMMYARSMIALGDAAFGLAQAVTIAIRYSCVRRQSQLKPG